MDLVSAAASGDVRLALQALRDGIAAQLDQTNSGRDYAALSARLQAVLTQLHELDTLSQRDPIEDAITKILEESA